jgi:hypothetical protein
MVHGTVHAYQFYKARSTASKQPCGLYSIAPFISLITSTAYFLSFYTQVAHHFRK